MLNKKIIITALSLTLSSISFAGTMGPVCAPGNVTVPCAAQQWDIGIQALYLKPAYHYEQDNLFNALAGTNFDPIEMNGDKWALAYALEGSYHFSTGNDISMQWTHFDTNHEHEHLDNLMQKTRFDQANLVFGQHIDFNTIKNARFYSGLQYANIHLTRTNSLNTVIAETPVLHAFLNNVVEVPIVFAQQNYVDYNGFGPMVGVDFAYMLGSSGFSLTANTATSLLYGTGRSNVNASIDGLVKAHPFSSRKMMVPGLEEKLGINYDTQFAQGLLSINGGYQALNYFNVVTRAQSSKTALSDFGLYGPYFGIRWLGVA